MTEFATIRQRTYSYLTDDDDEDKNVKGTKSVFITRKK